MESPVRLEARVPSRAMKGVSAHNLPPPPAKVSGEETRSNYKERGVGSQQGAENSGRW